MYSFPYLEPVCYSMSSSNCCFLICIQISQEAGKVIWHSHLFQNFPQFLVIHTIKGFGIVNKAEIDVFLELSCFFDDPVDVGNLISGSSAFFKSSLNIWKFKVHICWSWVGGEHYFTSVWDEYNCAVIWTFFGVAFLWDWNENWPFPVLWSLLSSPNLLTYWVQHIHSEVKWALLRKHHYKQSCGGDGIPVELFQILKDDAVNVPIYNLSFFFSVYFFYFFIFF